MPRPTSCWISASIRSIRSRIAATAYKRGEFGVAQIGDQHAPGAWVMQNSGFICAITACGVTPQAQNTGSSSAPTGTASP